MQMVSGLTKDTLKVTILQISCLFRNDPEWSRLCSLLISRDFCKRLIETQLLGHISDHLEKT